MFDYTKILFLVNPFHKGCHAVFLKTLSILQQAGLTGYLEKAVMLRMKDPDLLGGFEEISEVDLDIIQVFDASQGKEYDTKRAEVDLAISFGGDGTILHFSKIYHDWKDNTPDLIAFNFGSLGYLGSFELEDVAYVLGDIFNLDFSSIKTDVPSLIENEELFIAKLERQRLDITLTKAGEDTFELSSFHFEGGKKTENGSTVFHALNEINIRSPQIGNTLELEVMVNGKYLTIYEGFGLVFCTPTGSTSYNLSLHGAIIQNEVDCIGMISIGNTASIALKPLILPPDAVISVKNLSEEGVQLGNGDGSLIFNFEQGDTITITGSKSSIPQLMKTTKDPIKDWVLRLKDKLQGFDY